MPTSDSLSMGGLSARFSLEFSADFGLPDIILLGNSSVKSEIRLRARVTSGLLRLPWHVQLPWSSCFPLVCFVFHGIFCFRGLLVLPWSSSSSMTHFCCASVTNLLPRWLLVVPVDSSSYCSLLLVCLLSIPLGLYYCSSLALCIPAAEVQNENIHIFLKGRGRESARIMESKTNQRQTQECWRWQGFVIFLSKWMFWRMYML